MFQRYKFPSYYTSVQQYAQWNMKHSHTIYITLFPGGKIFCSPYSVLVGCQAFREIGQGGSVSWNLESPSQGMLQQQTPQNDLKFVHCDP